MRILLLFVVWLTGVLVLVPAPARSECQTGYAPRLPASYQTPRTYGQPEPHRTVRYGEMVPTTFFQTKDLFIFSPPVVVQQPPLPPRPATGGPAQVRREAPPDRIDRSGPLPVAKPLPGSDLARVSADAAPVSPGVDLRQVAADLRTCAACHHAQAKRGPKLFDPSGQLQPGLNWQALYEATRPGPDGSVAMPPAGKGAPLPAAAVERLRQLAQK